MIKEELTIDYRCLFSGKTNCAVLNNLSEIDHKIIRVRMRNLHLQLASIRVKLGWFWSEEQIVQREEERDR